MHAVVGTVEERAVSGHIMEPITSVPVTDFTVLTGNVPSRIGQGPIEVSCSSDIDAPLASDVIADRPTIRQRGFIDQLKHQSHGAVFPGIF